jgi:7SK snRNA methylphosphate capping enzyme
MMTSVTGLQNRRGQPTQNADPELFINDHQKVNTRSTAHRIGVSSRSSHRLLPRVRQSPRLTSPSNKMSYLADQSHGNYRHYYVRRRANDQYPLPLEQDERLQLLDPQLFKGKVVLDIGCNSGEVSVEIGMGSFFRNQEFPLIDVFSSSLAQQLQPSRVVGVDIDNALIDQCRATVEHAFSLQKPLDTLPSSLNAAIGDAGSAVEEPRRKKRKLKNGVAQDVQTAPTSIPEVDTHYFPAFFPQLFGPIEIQGATLLANPRETDGDQDQMSADVPKQKQPPPFPRNLEFHAADWTNTSIDTDNAGYDVILG